MGSVLETVGIKDLVLIQQLVIDQKTKSEFRT